MTELEQFYDNMPERLREHFFDSRLFPNMDFLKDSSNKKIKFREYKEHLGRRFEVGSEEYKLGLEYLTRLYGIKEGRK